MADNTQVVQDLWLLYKADELPPQTRADFETLAKANEIQLPEADPNDPLDLEARDRLFGAVRAPDFPAEAAFETETALREVGVAPEITGVVGGAVEEVIRNPIEAAASAAVQAVPATRALGAAGRIAADVLATGAGKVAEAELGLDRPITPGQAAVEAGIEVGASRFINTQLAKILPESIKQKIGFDIEKGFAEERLLKTQTLSTGRPETIAQAQEAFPTLKERVLAITQETTDALEAETFARAATRAKSFRLPEQSKLFRENERVKARVKEFVEGKTTTLRNLQMADSFKTTVTGALDNLNAGISAVSESLNRRQLASQDVDVTGLRKALRTFEIGLSEEIPEAQSKQLFDALDKFLVNKDGSIKENMTFGELRALETEITKNVLPKFAETKASQAQLAGLWSSKMRPIIDATESIAGDTNTLIREGIALKQQQRELLGERNEITKGKIPSLFGITDVQQLKRTVGNDQFMKNVLQNETSYRQAQNFLSKYNPELSAALDIELRKDVLRNTTVGKKGETISSKSLNTYIEKNEALLNEAFGTGYTDNLKRAATITEGTEFLDGFMKQAKAEKQDITADDFLRIGTRFAAGHQLAQASARLVFVDKIARKLFLPGVSDDILFNKLQGVNAQAALDQLAIKTLSDKGAYNAYQTIAREVGVKPLNQEDFEALSDVTWTELYAAANGVKFSSDAANNLTGLAETEGQE